MCLAAPQHARRRAKRSKKKLHVPLMHNPLWSKLPPAAATVVADVQPLLEPMLLPKVRCCCCHTLMQHLHETLRHGCLGAGMKRLAYTAGWPVQCPGPAYAALCCNQKPRVAASIKPVAAFVSSLHDPCPLSGP